MSSPADQPPEKPSLSLADLAKRRAEAAAPAIQLGTPATPQGPASEAPVQGGWHPIAPSDDGANQGAPSPSRLPPLMNQPPAPSAVPASDVPASDVPAMPVTNAPSTSTTSSLPPIRPPSAALPPLRAPSSPPTATPIASPVAPPVQATVPTPSPAPIKKWGADTSETRALKERMASLSGTRLVEALRQLLGQADDTLFKFVEQSSGTPDQEFLKAFKSLRQHRASVERSFRESNDIAWGLVQVDAKGGLFGGLGGLSLVNEDELEENLAESLAVANAERLMSSEASALSRRLAIVDGLPEDEKPSNPLAPGKIAEAFKSSMKEVIDLPVTAKMIVFKLFDRHVLTMLPDLLVEVNQAFVDAGVLPELKPVVVKSSKEDQPESEKNKSQGDEASSGNDANQGASGFSGQMVPWEAVQSLLSTHRSSPPMIMGPDGVEIPAPPVPMRDLISAIEHLNESVAKLDNIEPMAFKKALQDMLLSREGKNNDQPETLGVHEDAIDMIDLLFDFVMRDSELPSQIQSTLSRLQMPFLRIAVLEPEVFAQPDHPARRLLNALSDAGKTWNATTDKEGELKKLIESTVERMLAEVDRGSALCAELTGEFSTQWGEMKERSSRIEKRSAEASLGKEKLELARAASVRAITNNLAGLVLPDRLRMGIHRAWAHYLTIVALRDGEDSKEFRRASSLLVQVASIARVIKSSDPNANASRKGEVDILLADWSKGLSAAGLREEEIATWQAIMADFCNDKLGLKSADTAKITAMPTLIHEDIAASATKSAEPDQSVSQDALDVVSNLKNGVWVQWMDAGIRAKLAWVGGFTGKLMFVDHRGNKAVETHKQILAREIEQRMAIVLSDVPLVEQALGSIERKLTEGNPLL